MKLKKLLPLLLVVCLLLAACGNSSKDAPAGNDDAVITLAEPSAELTLGQTYQISYTVDPENTAITFSSSDSEVAPVDAEGTVTAQSVGSAVIAVSAGEYSKAYFEISVTAPSMQAIPNLLLNTSAVELVENTEYDILPTVKQGTELLDGCTLTWESSDETVASVENGKVLAKKEGSAVITASADIDGTHTEASCEITVFPYYCITISEDTVHAPVGKEFTLTAEVSDAAGNPVTPADGELELITSNADSVAVTEKNTFRVTGIGDTGVGFRYKGNSAMIPVDIFAVTADYFSGSCSDFLGEVAGERISAIKFASTVYQPRIYLTEDGIARLNAYAEANGYDTVTLRAYSILKDNAFVLANKHWLPNGDWGEVKLKISDLTTEFDFWSQSQGSTEIYMMFLFE